MEKILKSNMNVYTTNYTLYTIEPIILEDDRVFATIKVPPNYTSCCLLKNLKMEPRSNDKYDIPCGY